MADAKKCDRCGRYYDDKNSKDRYFRVNGIPIHQIALIDACDHHICEYDLCNECARDLFHWLCTQEEVEYEEKDDKYLMEEDDLTEEDPVFNIDGCILDRI